MTTNVGEVKAFREAIDATLASNAMLIENGKFIPIGPTDYRHEATIGNLSFASVDEHEARFHLFGHGSEHIWGIGYRGVQALGHSASMAIVSTTDRPDSLERRLSFESSTTGFPTISAEELSDLDDIRDAVLWATSPLIHNEIMLRFATPLEPEVESLVLRLNKDERRQVDMFSAMQNYL